MPWPKRRERFKGLPSAKPSKPLRAIGRSLHSATTTRFRGCWCRVRLEIGLYCREGLLPCGRMMPLSLDRRQTLTLALSLRERGLFLARRGGVHGLGL